MTIDNYLSATIKSKSKDQKFMSINYDYWGSYLLTGEKIIAFMRTSNQVHDEWMGMKNGSELS